ncbi:YncE family protein [Mycolicibacterium aubagnense]|uniref:YVTN family beta-propeller protein n=1 Tax=Mycolicibacterium aubagnense TaxID=319707 RepID=A0ABM7IGC0_9MYCO|nr:YncE family protein [Mycolicibacterium aubagnense]TLH70210.1 hypothetical protein C1S80_01410 [Mycolicibacterium aubagnense]WGI32572.1 YncE family protein [Mycolicibacterium aubagnense]BBX85840.1 hypothetical protein MAUB_37130 [Mycolicibacterium aubagnense]
MSRHRIANRAKASRLAQRRTTTGHRDARELRHHGEIAAWLGAGVLTLGVGTAVAAPAVAYADTTHHSGSTPTGSDPSGPKSGSTTGTRPLTMARGLGRLPRVAATTKNVPAADTSTTTQPTPASEKRLTPAAAGGHPGTSGPSNGPSTRTATTPPPTGSTPRLHPTVLSAAVPTTSPLAAVSTPPVTAPVASVSPWQPLINLIANTLVTFTGMNPTTPTPAAGNILQLVAYSAARWLEDTFNPAGIPQAGTPTVGAPDTVTGTVTGHVVFTDAAGAPLTYRASTDPSQGTVTINSDGVYTYTPTDAARLGALGGGAGEIRIIAYNDVQSSAIAVAVPVSPPTLANVTIPVSGGPQLLALNSSGGELVVSDTTGNTVSVINTHTRAVVATIPVSQLPAGVAVSPDGTVAYVASHDTVSVVALANNTVVATIPFNSLSPQFVTFTPDGKTVWVDVLPNSNAFNVASINTSTDTITSFNTVGDGTGMFGMIALDPKGCGGQGCLYVPDVLHAAVDVMSLGNKTTIASIGVGQHPGGAALSPDDGRLYVTNISDNTVSVINTATNTVIATVPVGKNPTGVAVSPDGSVVYVADALSNTVTAINTATNAVITTIPAGNDPVGLTISPDGTQLYVADMAGNTVSVISV